VKLLEQMAEALVRGDHRQVAELTLEAIGESLPPRAILEDGLLAGMKVVGERFRVREIFLPEVLMAARAMYAGMGPLEPLLMAEGVPSQGKVVLGTVRGDLHDIGKNLVCMLLEGAGFEVRDLGVDVSPEKFVDAVRGGGVNLLALSALLTTTLPNMKVTIELLKAAGLRGKVGVMVGGAPVNDRLATDIGADGYAEDAAGAVALARRLVGTPAA
jgi:5-methyltetrahydrofolate--homocysteine methyltransferase